MNFITRSLIFFTTFASFSMVSFAQEVDNCDYTKPDKDQFSTQLISIRKKLRVETDEEFRVKVFIKNTGNTPWFSHDSTCQGPKMFLGADKKRDRESYLYNNTIAQDDNNWVSPNRVAMDQLRTDPGEVASFTFWAKADSTPNAYKEYFTPVVEGVTWVEKGTFSFRIIMGETGEDMDAFRQKDAYLHQSGSLQIIDLNAEKRLVVDLSSQTLDVYLGDYLIKHTKVSSGAAKTPTPRGEYSILSKQYVRIGMAPPNYIMPRFMMFKAGGYGFHALPSLANDGGVFWTEALSHIGIPVSHGCIRLLPKDADFIYDFSEVGTTVSIKQ